LPWVASGNAIKPVSGRDADTNGTELRHARNLDRKGRAHAFLLRQANRQVRRLLEATGGPQDNLSAG
jgi:hypothetical protein